MRERTKPVCAIEVDLVSKFFGSTRAVQDFSLKVEQGVVHALLGPSASGKSTLMKMIAGLLRPDRGKIRIYGVDVRNNSIKLKNEIGYVPESPHLYEYLTGSEYLNFVADIHGLSPKVKLERIRNFLIAFQLEGRENEWITGYSRGMKQKIAIIAALLHKPRLLVMDEPMSGLDPEGARVAKDLIRKLTAEGVTTIFSTHVLGIAEAVSDKVSIMYEGKTLSEGTVAEVREKAGMPGSKLEDVFFRLTRATSTTL